MSVTEPANSLDNELNPAAHNNSRGFRLRIGVVAALLAALVSLGLWRAKARDIAPEVEQAGGIYQSFNYAPLVLRFTNAMLGGQSTQSHRIRFSPGQVTDEWLRRNRDRLERLSSWALVLRNTQVTNAGIRQLEGMSNLLALELSGTKLTDAAIASLNRIPGLSVLDVSRTGITGAGLAMLSRLNWAALTVDTSQLDAAGLAKLTSLTELNGLGVYDASDATVALLKNIPFQHSLSIQGEQVTSASLPAIKALIQSRTIYSMELLDTQLTEQEVIELRQVDTSCHVWADTSLARERLHDSSTPWSNNDLW